MSKRGPTLNSSLTRLFEIVTEISSWIHQEETTSKFVSLVEEDAEPKQVEQLAQDLYTLSRNKRGLILQYFNPDHLSKVTYSSTFKLALLNIRLSVERLRDVTERWIGRKSKKFPENGPDYKMLQLAELVQMLSCIGNIGHHDSYLKKYFPDSNKTIKGEFAASYMLPAFEILLLWCSPEIDNHLKGDALYNENSKLFSECNSQWAEKFKITRDAKIQIRETLDKLIESGIPKSNASEGTPSCTQPSVSKNKGNNSKYTATPDTKFSADYRSDKKLNEALFRKNVPEIDDVIVPVSNHLLTPIKPCVEGNKSTTQEISSRRDIDEAALARKIFMNGYENTADVVEKLAHDIQKECVLSNKCSKCGEYFEVTVEEENALRARFPNNYKEPNKCKPCRRLSGSAKNRNSNHKRRSSFGGSANNFVNELIYEILVPSEYISCLIGCGGSVIEQIRYESGAAISFDPNASINGECCISVTVRSTQQFEVAKKLIERKLTESY